MGFRTGHFFEFGEFRLEPEKLRLWHRDSVVNLRPKALEILLLLVRNRDRTVLRDEILETVWKDTFVEEGNINFNVSLIRKALAEGKWKNGAPIMTVPKSGYRFVAEVLEVFPDAHAAAKRTSLTTPDKIARPSVRWHFVGIAVAALLLLTSFAMWSRDGAVSKEPPSIAGRNFSSFAVLPLRQIGDDPSTRLVGLGIADQLISKMGSSGRFTVRPFSAVENFDQSGVEALAFGKKLGVDAILEGTVQSSDGRLRLSVRMFDARDGAMLWSESFEESATDVFALQDKLAENVARTLQISLESPGSSRYPLNAEAYSSYLRGRYFFDKRDTEGFKKARAEFEKAIAIDPKFALAYSGLADVYMLQLEHDASRHESMRNARVNALKALELDPTLAEAQTSLAWIYRMQDWNWEASERHFKRAIEINPNYLNARQWYAMLLATLGRFNEAVLQIEKAREIDPLSWVVLNNYTAIAVYMREPDLIRTLAAQRAEITEKETSRLRDLVVATDRAGEPDKALALAEKLREINGGTTGSKGVDARMVVLYEKFGRTNEAKQMLDKLEARIPDDTFLAYHLAMAYADLGRNDDAIRMIEICFAANDPRLLWIKVEPRFDPLRSDLRFQNILRKMALA